MSTKKEKSTISARTRTCAESTAKKQAEKPKRRTPLEQEMRRITERMKALGLYKVQYTPLIRRLAELYMQLDQLEKMYTESGGTPVVEHTNKAGATNQQLNPYLEAQLQIRNQILAHERELGLTPTALRRIEGKAAEKPKRSTLEETLMKLAGGSG